jgi:hypothetical protein
MAAGEIEPFDCLTLPGLATPDRPLHPGDPRKPGEALWPWFRTAAQHEQDRLLEPRDFHALTQQDPRSEGGTEWPPDYFDREGFLTASFPAERALRVLYYDGAGSPGAKIGDWHAAAIVDLTADGGLWARLRLWRGPQEQAADELCSLQMQFRPDACAVEANFGGTVLIPLIGHAAQKAGRPDLVGQWHGVTNTLPKITRIRRLGTYLAQGLLHLLDDAGGRETKRQMEQFPAADHDDGPDALDGEFS